MNKWHRIITICGAVSMVVFLTCLASTTALLTDRDIVEGLFNVKASNVEIKLYVDELEDSTDVDSGEDFDIQPWINNVRSGYVYVFMEVDVPKVTIGNENIVLFTFDTSEYWYLMKSQDGDDYLKLYYAYGTIGSDNNVDTATLTELGGLDSTEPLMTKATFSPINPESDQELTLIIKAYAVTSEAYEESGIDSPEDVWDATVKVTGE